MRGSQFTHTIDVANLCIYYDNSLANGGILFLVTATKAPVDWLSMLYGGVVRQE